MIQIASVTPWSSRARVSASFRKASAIFVKIIVPRIRPGSFDRRQPFRVCNDPGDALSPLATLENGRTKHWCQFLCPPMLSDCHCPISSGWRFHLHNQAASTTSTASEATAAPATARNFFDDFMYSNVFLVEDIECRQIHDRDSFLMESDSVTRRDVFRRYICLRPTGFCGCAGRQCQGHPGDPQ